MLLEGERAIIISIQGDHSFRNYMLTNGLALGSIIHMNYSPSYTELVNITVGGKMMSLRSSDFQKIEFVKI